MQFISSLFKKIYSYIIQLIDLNDFATMQKKTKVLLMFLMNGGQIQLNWTGLIE